VTTAFEHFMAQCELEAGIPPEPVPGYSALIAGAKDLDEIRGRLIAALTTDEQLECARLMGPVGFERLIDLYIDHLNETRSPDTPPQVTSYVVETEREAATMVKGILDFPSGAN
jgi:hypothetical protein